MSEPVWITLIVVVGIVVLVALWLGRRLRISRDADGSVSLEAGDENSGRPAKPDIQVAQNLKSESLRAGDIAGVKSSGNDSPLEEVGDIDVANNAELKDAQVGDIVGVKTGPGKENS